MGADDGAGISLVRKETILKKRKLWLLAAATTDAAADNTKQRWLPSHIPGLASIVVFYLPKRGLQVLGVLFRPVDINAFRHATQLDN